MFTQTTRQLTANANAQTTVLNRPPLRTALRWAALLAVAASAACTSMPVAGSSFGTTRYSALAPMHATSRAASFAAERTPSSLYAPNIAIGDSLLSATVSRLRRLSPSFDSAIVAIEQSGIPVVIGTAEQLKDQMPPGYRYVKGWQAVTAIYPLTPTNAPGKPIDHFSVIVRLTDLRAALQTAATPEDSALFNRYVERVVAHEIYGHLIPQLKLGKTAPIACDDPTSGVDWYSACVMQRERHVMAQLVEARGTYAELGTHE
jgi:hypothetical protein